MCVYVCVCECKREQFIVVTGYPPALWVHMFELALNSWFLLIWIWGIWIQFVWASERTHWYGWFFLFLFFSYSVVFFFQYVASITIGFSVFILWLAHLCEHINVYTKAKTFADSGNTWQTFVEWQYNTKKNKKKLFLFFMSGLFFSTFLLKCEYCSNHYCHWLVHMANTHFYC